MSQVSSAGAVLGSSKFLERFQKLAATENALGLIGDTILVEKLGRIETKTAGGIIMPTGPNGSYKHTASDDVIEFGMVLLTGPGDVDNEGNNLKMTTKIGDIIALPMNVQWYSQFGEMKEYSMNSIGRMRDSQVMMVFKDYFKAMEVLNEGTENSKV
jgi:co-chaperonin GroES (HSP10)